MCAANASRSSASSASTLLVGELGPLELEEEQLGADHRAALVDLLHARAARGIGGVGGEVEAGEAPGPADELVHLGEAAHELDEPVGVERRRPGRGTAASSSAFASAAASSCSRPASSGAGSSGPRSQTMSSAVRSVAVMPGSYSRRARDRLPIARSVHHQEARGEAGPLEEVLRLAMAGQRGRVDTRASGLGAERDQLLDEQLPHPDRPASGSHVDLVDHAEPGAVAQHLDHARSRSRRSCSSSVPTSTVASSSVEQRRERGAERLGPRLARRPERAAALLRAAPRGARRASSATRARSASVATRASSTARSYAEIWSILPRIVRRLRCAPSYVAHRVQLVGRETREPFHHLRRRQRVVARGSAATRRPEPSRWRRGRRCARAVRVGCAVRRGRARSGRRCRGRLHRRRFGRRRSRRGTTARADARCRPRARPAGAPSARRTSSRPGRCSSPSSCAAAPAPGGDRSRRGRARRTCSRRSGPCPSGTGRRRSARTRAPRASARCGPCGRSCDALQTSGSRDAVSYVRLRLRRRPVRRHRLVLRDPAADGQGWSSAGGPESMNRRPPAASQRDRRARRADAERARPDHPFAVADVRRLAGRGGHRRLEHRPLEERGALRAPRRWRR